NPIAPWPRNEWHPPPTPYTQPNTQPGLAAIRQRRKRTVNRYRWLHPKHGRTGCLLTAGRSRRSGQQACQRFPGGSHSRREYRLRNDKSHHSRPIKYESRHFHRWSDEHNGTDYSDPTNQSFHPNRWLHVGWRSTVLSSTRNHKLAG